MAATRFKSMAYSGYADARANQIVFQTKHRKNVFDESGDKIQKRQTHNNLSTT
jgi:hypothetical protein